MADEGVATKAPESDAIDKSNDKSNDKSIMPEDTAQEGASMGVSTARQTQKHSVVELMSRVRSTV